MPEFLRTTESPMELPSARRVGLLGSRALRLRRPHCGGAPVFAPWESLRSWGAVRARYGACNVRFERSNDRYFAAAMITNLLLSELLFAVSFTTAVVVLRPNVPWDAMTYWAAAGMLLGPVLLYPVAKVLWLTVDVLIRPVRPEEML
jgi:hypothetical protein